MQERKKEKERIPKISSLSMDRIKRERERERE